MSKNACGTRGAYKLFQKHIQIINQWMNQLVLSNLISVSVYNRP